MSDTPELSADEIAYLDKMRLVAQDLTAADSTLETPPAGLWDSIAGSASSTDEPIADAPTSASSQPAVDLTDQPVDVSETSPTSSSNVIQGPWRKAAPVLLSAAAVLVLLFGGLTVFGGDDKPDPLAEVALSFTEGPGFDPLGASSMGNAAWLNDGDTRCIDLDVSDLPNVEDAQLEVWLIDTNVEEMVSLGNIDGNTCLDVPASVDPAALPVVDISIEPNDGVETHSGRSILRGVLEL